MINKEEFIFLIKNNKNPNVCRESYIKSHHNINYDEINIHDLLYFSNNFSFKQKLFNYVNNIIKIPVCPVCNKNVNWGNTNNKYFRYCSNECINNDNNIKNRIKSTNNIKYGSNCVFQNADVKNKIKNSLIKKYGVEHISQSKEIKNKVIQTNQKNLGVNYPSQSPLVKNKIKKTLFENYGVSHPMKNINIKNKSIINQTKNTIKLSADIMGKDVIITNNGNNNYLIKNQCKIHSEYTINKKVFYWRVILGKCENPCIICNPVGNNSSLKEDEIKSFIENDLKLKTEKNKTILNNKEIDIYIPESRLGVEFDGLYWHSSIYKNNKYHLNKTELCEKKEIQLLHVFEDEWVFKKEIVKSIIKSKLNIFNSKIFSEDCVINNINSDKSKIFLNENNIHDYTKSKLNFGLYNDDELVFLISFKKTNKNEYKMINICNKINHYVVDGASKLLNYFIITYQPKSIITFSDRRYSNDSLLKQLGFSFLNNTKPDYYYFKSSGLTRYNKKEIQVFNNDKEQDINNKYLKIFDCGKSKFILNIN